MSNDSTLCFEDLFEDEDELGVLSFSIKGKTTANKKAVAKPGVKSSVSKPISKPGIKAPVKKVTGTTKGSVKASVVMPSISKPKVTIVKKKTTAKTVMPAQAKASKARTSVGKNVLSAIKNTVKPVKNLNANLNALSALKNLKFTKKPTATAKKPITVIAKTKGVSQLQLMKTASIPKKVELVKEQAKSLLGNVKAPTKKIEKKIAKAAVLSSKIANKPKKEIIKDIAVEAKPITPTKINEVVKLGVEESLGLPGLKAIVESNEVSPGTKNEILEKLNQVQQTIISDRDEGFRRNVLRKLKSIDYKIQKGTLAFQGSFL